MLFLLGLILGPEALPTLSLTYPNLITLPCHVVQCIAMYYNGDILSPECDQLDISVWLCWVAPSGGLQDIFPSTREYKPLHTHPPLNL